MFLIPRCQVWTQQPQGHVEIDRTNQLAKTITHCIPMGGVNRDVVTGNTLTLFSGASTQIDSRGKSLKGSGSAAVASIPLDLSPYRNLTISFWMRWDTFANNDALAMEHGENFVGNSGFLIDPNSAGGQFEVGVGSPEGKANDWSAPRPTALAWHHYYITLDRTTSQSSTMCIDGVSQPMTAVATLDVADYFGNNTLYLFSRSNSTLFGAGRLENIVIRGGYVGSVTEARKEFNNPWQIFKRPDSRIFVPVSVGGGPINITGILLSTLDSITTSIHGCLGHVSTFSISLDTISITGSGNLTHIGTSVNVLDGLIVVFNGAVAIAGSVSGTLACTLDSIVFSGVGNLNHSTTISITLDDVFVSLAGTVAGTPENIDGTLSIVLDGIGFTSSGNSGTLTLTEDDINAIMTAIINNPKTLTIPKFLGLK